MPIIKKKAIAPIVIAGLVIAVAGPAQFLHGRLAITLSDGDAYSISGLSYPTKFNLASTFELPFNEDWFGVPPGAPHGQVPKLGVLHPSLMRRARAPMEAAK